MVAAMCGSTEREPITVGKPSTFMMDFLLQKYVLMTLSQFRVFPCVCRFGTETSRTCMVGDRLDTDIFFRQNAGCKTLLVLSGQYYLLYDTLLSFQSQYKSTMS
ncbi:Phosphoglycolate phosphatase 2 [Cardamine amara subsp. amara]|uniref:Phosphoglycolate phosphatase 2 n=1 Tax=Cardamine amara subsp. amara TaxID=228776 RepID=A0ABD0ZGY9_CARAN